MKKKLILSVLLTLAVARNNVSWLWKLNKQHDHQRVRLRQQSSDEKKVYHNQEFVLIW